MKSHHPEYLESFVKTCMAYGLDEEATTVLLDNARHKDYLENSPEYREGFHNTLVELNQDNQNTKSAASIIKAIGRGAAGLGRGIESLANMFAPVVTRGGKAVSTTTKKPGFLPGLLSIPAGYGLYLGGKNLYGDLKSKVNDALTDYTTNRMISRGEMPSLAGFEGATAGGNKGRFADALYAMQAADAGMTAGDVRPLMSSRQDASKLPILQGLRKKLYETQTAIDAPITDPSGYANVANLLKRKAELEKQYAQASRYSKAVDPILKKQMGALEELHKKYVTSGLSGDEQKKFEALASRVPGMSGFQKQLGQ